MPFSNSYVQSSYRFRNDDGSETSATWIGAADTAVSISLDTNFRIRIKVSATGMLGWTDVTWNLYYSLNNGAYTAVTASSPVKFSASSNLTDGQDATEQLAYIYNYVTDNNGVKETTGGATNSSSSVPAAFETEWCLTLDSAQVSSTDTLDFRIYRGTTALNSYTVTPRATASGGSSQSLTLSCAAGSYSLTGTNADLTVTRHYTLTCEAGSYSLTGTNADLTVKRNYVLACEGGSYALTGTDATLTVQRNYSLVCSAGSYSLTGTDATLTAQYNYTLTCEAGSYALTGADITLDPTFHYSLICEAGSYTYTGTDVTFGNSKAYSLTCASGSYSLTGSDISFAVQRNYTFACEAGSYSLTGTDADLVLLRNYILACEAGAYALTGTNTALTSARTMACEAGSYALTGTNANLYRALVMACEAGSYALTGSDASLTSHRIFALGVGSYVLVGTACGLFILTPTPACRTYVIKGDGTSSVIAANETYLLTKSFWGQLYWPANYWAKAASLVGTPTGREWNVNAENREYAVLMENRTYSVPYCTDDD